MSMANKDMSYFRQQPKKHKNARCQKNIVKAAIEESMTFGFHQGYAFVFGDLSHTSILYYYRNCNIHLEYVHSNWN